MSPCCPSACRPSAWPGPHASEWEICATELCEAAGPQDNIYETLSTANDFLIGVMFVVGSVLFLSESTSTVGTWFFIVGSVQLLIRPSIRLARRVQLQRFDSPDRTDHGGDY